MDAEMAFLDHQDNMELQEKLIKYIVKKVLEKNQIELNILERETEKLEKVFEPFIKMTYENTIKELQEMGSEIKMNDDLGATDETMLTEKYDQPIFIEKFPAKIKAFYMKRDPKNQDFILGSDLLAPEGYGEIIGGSEREIDYEVLLKRIKEENLDPEIFSWYLDLRKYGSVPHSGFGFGLERLVVWICGLKHVRESIPFPRTIIRYKP
jgi:asparaginyl-tRNA synthetase